MNMLKKLTATMWLAGKENAPTICAVASGVCTVMAVVEGSKATLKASEIVEKHQEGMESEDQTERREATLNMVKEAAPVYAKTVIFTGASLGLLFASNKMHLKREAALLAAANLTEMAYKNYADKVREIAGEETSEKIDEECAKERAEKVTDCITDEDISIWTGTGDEPFIDSWTGRKFRGSQISIREALSDLNNRKLSEWRIYLNDFYDLIHVPEVEAGEYIGWKSEDGIIEPRFRTTIINNTTYTVLEYNIRPHLVYDDRY